MNHRETTHKNGIPWDQAPLPPRLHRCKPWSMVWTTYMDNERRCACGGLSLNHNRWEGRNSRREVSAPSS